MKESGRQAAANARSEQGRKAANTRHSSEENEKVIAKKFAAECWLDWQSDPSKYAGPTEWARDMLDKQPALTSEQVVCRWHRQWKTRPPPRRPTTR